MKSIREKDLFRAELPISKETVSGTGQKISKEAAEQGKHICQQEVQELEVSRPIGTCIAFLLWERCL